MKDVIKQALKREMAGEDPVKVLEISREHSVAPTSERLEKIRGSATSVEKVADFPSAPWRMVTMIESLANQKRITPNMLQAAQFYVTLRYLMEGRSAGIGRYGDFQEASPSWSRINTTEEKMKAAKLFKGAQLAAFGTQTKSGEWVLDEALRQAVEPILLGDVEKSWPLEKIGGFLGTYRKRDTKSATGVQEIVAVLRRLRLFFRFNADDD